MLYPSLQSRGDYLGIEILDWGGVGWGALGPEKHHFLQCRQHHQNRLGPLRQAFLTRLYQFETDCLSGSINRSVVKPF
jgi:hypothetical protein